MSSNFLEVIYHDPHLIAINKPHGLLVHASGIASDVTEHAVQQLRDQTGKWVFPVHRLDRKTAGVLLFAFDQETNSLMQQMFMEQKVEKVYHAIVRGFTPDEGTIDYPLTNDRGKIRDAVTCYRTLGRTELPVAIGKFATSRYSLVEAKPLTGRMHQIRKHFAHIFHPIIGDRPHGCNKQNRLFLEKWGHREMLLHAVSLTFNHPHLGELIHLKAKYQTPFLRMAAEMGFSLEG